MYLIMLGSYRAFYILNWIVRYARERHFEPIAVIFGVVQTALYLDFAWVYWTRQRVKLRNGGIVDSEDFRRGWLVARLLGKGRESFDEERITVDANENDTNKASRGPRGRWGARGISVSADEEDLDSSRSHNRESFQASSPQQTDRAQGQEDRVKADNVGLSDHVSKSLVSGEAWQDGREG